MLLKHRIPKVAALLALILVLGTFAPALAVASGPVDRDIAVLGSGGNVGWNGDSSFIRVGSTGGVSGTCVPYVAGAFSIDVSNANIQTTLTSAMLTLTVAGVNADNGYPMTLSLWSATEDISELPLTSTGLSTLRDANLNSNVVLSSAPVVGSTITFPTSTQFVAEVNKAYASADKRLTVLVQITSCSLGNRFVDFKTRESGVPGQFVFEGPNAVTVTETSARRIDTLPLYGILGLLALVTVGGVVISRRRAAAR